MKPEFPRIEKAISFTTEYFKVQRIAACIARFGGGLNLDYLESYYEATMRFQNQMEDEINQNIYGSNKNIQVAMFEQLKDWLDNDWRLNAGYENSVIILVDNYNEVMWEEYSKQVAEEEKKFIDKGIYERGHLDKYQITNRGFSNIFGHYVPPSEETVTNQWFYSNDKMPAVINTSYLPQYYQMVNELVNNFKKCSVPYLNRYKEGKIVSSSDIIIEQKQIANNPETASLPPPQYQPEKLKLHLSVPQIVALFMGLRARGFIKQDVNTQLARFIRANFSSNYSEEISEKSLINQFSDVEVTAIDFWLTELKQLKIELTNLKK